MTKGTFTLMEASDLTGLDHACIRTWITWEWVSPLAPEALDQEDIARLRLIHELQADFGANEEAIPLILHLVDQLCHARELLRRLEGKNL